jgi:hypothetical protein
MTTVQIAQFDAAANAVGPVHGSFRKPIASWLYHPSNLLKRETINPVARLFIEHAREFSQM